jgi:hypothetical protein
MLMAGATVSKEKRSEFAVEFSAKQVMLSKLSIAASSALHIVTSYTLYLLKMRKHISPENGTICQSQSSRSSNLHSGALDLFVSGLICKDGNPRC